MSIKKTLHDRFTFLDIIKASESIRCDVNFRRLEDTYGCPIYVDISLDYTVGDFVGKRVMFHNFDFEIIE